MSIYNLTNFNNPNITLNTNVKNPYFCQLSKISSGNYNGLVTGFSSGVTGGFDNVLGNMALNASSAIVIQKAGWYNVKFSLFSQTNYVPFYLYRNGSVEYGSVMNKDATFPNLGYTGTTWLNINIQCSVNDKLQIYGIDGNNVGTDTPPYYCYFSAEYLGF